MLFGRKITQCQSGKVGRGVIKQNVGEFGKGRLGDRGDGPNGLIVAQKRVFYGLH